MSKQWITELTFLVVLAIGSLRTTNSIEVMDCEKLNKSCLLVIQCESAIDLVKTRMYKPLKNMSCGIDAKGPKVCCPIDNPIVFTNDTETATKRDKTTPMSKTMATTTETVNQYGLPSRQVCGLSKPGQDRIVGGDIASLEEFPWLVRINSRLVNDKNKPGVFNCAGSLISERYVLTAAHCTYSRTEISVRLGEWDTETWIDCHKGTCTDPPVDIKITKVIRHPSFNPITLKNDIALLLLEKAANFTDFVRPVCLPITKYPISQDYVVGTAFWVAGWGVTEFGSGSIIKRKVDLDTVAMDTCVEKMPQVKEFDQNNILCAGGKIGKDTCNGDSGGSLVKQIADDGYMNWYLYGITSFGSLRCGVTDKPSVYTRVTSYMDWIKENIAS